MSKEKQLTHDLSYHHDLDNNDNFSPDGKWLVYDTRTDEGGIAASTRIERVHIETGEVEVLYQTKNAGNWGPGVGAVSYNPKASEVIFIHGLPDASEKRPYEQWRRTGVIVKDAEPGIPVFMDARDVIPPFTAGALRGGTHRHEWSGDGEWIGFTYNDEILKNLENSTGEKRNLRTIGVSKKLAAVKVKSHPEHVQGEWFSALVVRVVPNPKPGSDEIWHAANDSWVGTHGYPKNGQMQMARTFLGTAKAKNGQDVQEVFIVDIPTDITIPGPLGPLEGTDNDFPMPPSGALQRRLTFTADTEYPGCSGIVRSSPNGQHLAYLAKDENGISQIFTISPLGGKPEQLTFHENDVTGNLRWHPGGQHLTYVFEGNILLCKMGNEPFADRIRTLTTSPHASISNLVWSPDGKTLAYNKLVEPTAGGEMTRQIFVMIRPNYVVRPPVWWLHKSH